MDARRRPLPYRALQRRNENERIVAIVRSRAPSSALGTMFRVRCCA